MQIDEPKGIPTTEWCQQFFQAMVNRMSVSFCKYGAVAEAYPKRVNALTSLLLRIRAYIGRDSFIVLCAQVADAPEVRHRRDTGNTEYMMDAANFAMIEFMHPSIEGAHFTATDADGSTGRMTNTGVVNGERNTEDRKLTEKFYSRSGD